MEKADAATNATGESERVSSKGALALLVLVPVLASQALCWVLETLGEEANVALSFSLGEKLAVVSLRTRISQFSMQRSDLSLNNESECCMLYFGFHQTSLQL